MLHEKKNKAVFRNAMQVKWVPSFSPYNDYKTMKPLLKKIKYYIFSTIPLDFFSQIVAPRVRNIFPSAALFSSTWTTSNALHPISFFWLILDAISAACNVGNAMFIYLIRSLLLRNSNAKRTGSDIFHTDLQCLEMLPMYLTVGWWRLST